MKKSIIEKEIPLLKRAPAMNFINLVEDSVEDRLAALEKKVRELEYQWMNLQAEVYMDDACDGQPSDEEDSYNPAQSNPNHANKKSKWQHESKNSKY